MLNFCPPTGNNAFKSPEDFKVSLPLRTNYLYGRIKKSLPEMYAFTVCMWLKSSASPGIGTPFSYGVPGQANEIVLIEWGNNPIELLVNDKVGSLLRVCGCLHSLNLPKNSKIYHRVPAAHPERFLPSAGLHSAAENQACGAPQGCVLCLLFFFPFPSSLDSLLPSLPF